MFKANNYLITIVETDSYLEDAERIFTDDERAKIANFLAANPDLGSVIPGTNGVRRLRWVAKGIGRRGVVRIIYYFRDLNMPVFLLALYTRAGRITLTEEEKQAWCELVDVLVEQYAERWEKILRLPRRAS